MKSHALFTFMVKRLAHLIPGSSVVALGMLLPIYQIRTDGISLWSLFIGSFLMVVTMITAGDCISAGLMFGVSRQSIWRILLGTGLLMAIYLALICQTFLLIVDHLALNPIVIFSQLAPQHWFIGILLLSCAIWIVITLTSLFNISSHVDNRPLWRILTIDICVCIVLAGSLALIMLVINWLLHLQTPPLLIFGLLLAIQIGGIWLGTTKAPAIE